MKDGIRGFETPQTRFLSNFYPCTIEYEGLSYPSSEHAYQAAKTLSRGERQRIASCTGPGTAKHIGRKVKMRSDWDSIKREVMKDILRIKFSLPGLRDSLLATDELYLEETNWWGDTYWGVCNGQGANNLGHVLMEIREEIKNEVYSNHSSNESN